MTPINPFIFLRKETADTWLFKMKLKRSVLIDNLLRIIRNFNLLLKKVINSTCFKPWSAGNQNSKTFRKTDKVNKRIPVLDIA